MGRPLKLAAPVMAIAIFVSACSTRTHSVAYDPPTFHAPDPLPPAADLAQHQLEPGDIVTITVFELNKMSGDETVDDKGRISVPLVGSLAVEGLTLKQFSGTLTQTLAARYLQSPHVVVTLKQVAAKTVTVDGSVQEPGVYAAIPNQSLLQTIALAKGPAKDANLKRVVIFRTIDGVRKAAAFDLTTIRKGKDPDPQVYADDLVVVDGSRLPKAYQTLLSSLRLAGFVAFGL